MGFLNGLFGRKKDGVSATFDTSLRNLSLKDVSGVVQTEFGFATLPMERQNQIIPKIMPMIYEGALDKAFEKMSSGELKTVTDFLDEHKGDDMRSLQYLHSSIENFGFLVHQEILIVKDKVADLLQGKGDI